MPRNPLFSRLPKIFQRLDRPNTSDPNPGVLERYLSVLDSGFDSSLGSAKKLLDLRTPDRIPDMWSALLGPLVGHQWRDDKSFTWNRRRIKSAIKRYSYKGNLTQLGDIIRESGGTEWSVKDMASTLLVPGYQGKPGYDDCAVIAADYFHPGAFVLFLSDGVINDEFLQALQEALPAGEVWYLVIQHDDELLPYEALANESVFSVGIDFDGPLGIGLTLIEEIFLSFEPDISDGSTIICGDFASTFTGLTANSVVSVGSSNIRISTPTEEAELIQPNSSLI